MTQAAAPALEIGTPTRCCWECARFVEYSGLNDRSGDCKLGPNPRDWFKPGVMPRYVAADSVCAAFDQSHASILMHSGER